MHGLGEQPPRDLDALIERALCAEPFLKAPASLQCGVEERLRIVRLREREYRRFRVIMSMMAVALVVSLLTAGVAVWFTHLSLLANVGVSGGKGRYDFWATALQLTWSGYRGAYTLIFSLLLGVFTFVIGWMPLRKYLSHH